MRVDVSAEANEFVRARGGRLWVWTARPRVCCASTPPYMRAATEPPPGLNLDSFSPVDTAELEIWFRSPGDRRPDTLEIAMHGRRRPQVEAYWDGCRMAM